MNPPAHRAEGRARLHYRTPYNALVPPLYPPPEASAIPPPGCAQGPPAAPQAFFGPQDGFQNGFQDELEFQTAPNTLSGRIWAPFRPPRGPLLASKIRSRGPRERLFGPFSPKSWNVKKYRKYYCFLTIFASPGVSRTLLTADFRARLGDFPSCKFRSRLGTRSGTHFGRFRPQFGPQNGAQTGPDLGPVSVAFRRGRGPTRGCSRLGRLETPPGRLGPFLDSFWALFGALFGPCWRS